MKRIKSSTWIKRVRKVAFQMVSEFEDYDKLSKEEIEQLVNMTANIDNDLGDWDDIIEKRKK